MDLEFHYHIMHLIAAKAGFDGDDLRILTYSSQFTDDNDQAFKIRRGRNWFYHNRISQTMNILKPQEDRLRIYPLFHFIPGDPQNINALRLDGAVRDCNTTANSAYAQRIMHESLRTANLYQIGIACHAYADTWAHQHFVGYRDRFNAFPGFFNRLIPNIGHADAKRLPDWPACVWQDVRLTTPRVENKTRFLEAARALFHLLRQFADPSCSDLARHTDGDALIHMLDLAVGRRDDTNALQAERITRYQNIANTADGGKTAIPPYDKSAWFEACIASCTRFNHACSRVRHSKRRYSFKGLYQQSDWFKFQEAVKAYALMAETVLATPLSQARQTLNLRSSTP